MRRKQDKADGGEAGHAGPEDKQFPDGPARIGGGGGVRRRFLGPTASQVDVQNASAVTSQPVAGA